MRIALPFALLCAVSACATGNPCAPGAIISPEQLTSRVEWTAEERAAPAAMRNLHRTPSASAHLLRVTKELTRRRHHQSDLVLFAVSGRGTVRVDDRPFDVAPGSVVEVPRDVSYEVMAGPSSALVMYLVFTPPLEPNDTAMITETRESAWRWNMWVQ